MKPLTTLDRMWLRHVRDDAFATLPHAALTIARFERIPEADVPMAADALYRRLRSFARRGFIDKRDGVWVVTEEGDAA